MGRCEDKIGDAQCTRHAGHWGRHEARVDLHAGTIDEGGGRLRWTNGRLREEISIDRVFAAVLVVCPVVVFGAKLGPDALVISLSSAVTAILACAVWDRT
jgi:hypothetical protein